MSYKRDAVYLTYEQAQERMQRLLKQQIDALNHGAPLPEGNGDFGFTDGYVCGMEDALNILLDPDVRTTQAGCTEYSLK